MEEAGELLLIVHQTAVLEFNCSRKETGASIHKWITMWNR